MGKAYPSVDDYCVLMRRDTNSRSESLDVFEISLRCLLVLKSSFEEQGDRIVGRPDIVKRTFGPVRSDTHAEELAKFRRVNLGELAR